MQRQTSRRVFAVLEDLLRAFAAKQIADQNAVFAKDERIQRQGVLALVFHRRDLFAAARTRIVGMEPTRPNCVAELELGLMEQLIESCEYFVVGHR